MVFLLNLLKVKTKYMKKITFLIIAFFSIHLSAQSVSGYSFTQSTETYTPVNGTNSLAVGDDGTHNYVPIGFDFIFGGVSYNTFSISTNGFIRLGNPIAGSHWSNAMTTTSSQKPLIAPFWDDHNRGTGAIQYKVTGTAPNQVLEVGWENIVIASSTTNVNAQGSFKLRIYETTNIIEFVYGNPITFEGELSATIGINHVNGFVCVSPGTPATASSMFNVNTITTTHVVSKKFTFTPLPDCTSVPTNLTTIASVSSICPDFPISLSVDGVPLEANFLYQWQSSDEGEVFIDIESADEPIFNAAQTTAMFYRVLISCGEQTFASQPVQVTMSDPNTCYCFPNYTDGKTDGDLISNVEIEGTTLANYTGVAPSNPFYTYFTGEPHMTATLIPGQTYNISVSVGTYAWQNVAVWIDYNDDLEFSPNERVGYNITPILSNGTGTFPITLSCDAPDGVHRMRIRDVWDIAASTILPCATYGYGEVEDYDITISSVNQCLAPTGLSVTQVSASGANLTWAYGCNQEIWDVHLAVSPGTIPTGDISHPGVALPLTVSGLEPLTTYDFYVRAMCNDLSTSEWSGPFSFTTLPMAVPNDDCMMATSLMPGLTFEENAITATNLGATLSLGHPNVTCGIFAFGGDVWFTAIVPESGKLTLETRAAADSPLIDTVMSAYTGTCGELTLLGCSDEEGIDGFSLLNLTDLAPGSTIYVRVWEYANDTYGSFQVSAYNPVLSQNEFSAHLFSFAPNPVTDVLSFNSVESITSVKVFNVLGQTVLAEQGSSIKSIDLSSLRKGTYLVQVGVADSYQIIKIVKN